MGKAAAARRIAAAPGAGGRDAPASGGAPAVAVRHYCQGIGDCHLLRFPKADGGFFWMLVDCGVHGSARGGPAIIR